MYEHENAPAPRTAVVGGGEEGDEVAACKALEAVHDALVSSDDELEVVVLTELHHAVGLEGRGCRCRVVSET